MTAVIVEGTPAEPGEDDVLVDLFAKDDEGKFVDVEAGADTEQSDDVDVQEPVKDAGKDQHPETKIPEKFRNKSAEEIAASYADLEREFGRRNNELNELRRLTDDILRAQLSPEKPAEKAEEPELTAQDFLNDPVNAVRKVIENDPERKRAKDDAIQAARDAALTRFRESHPDAKDIMANPSFIEWLQKVPSRYQRFVAADANLDFDTANETISTYKEVISVAKAEADQQREGALRDVKSAAPANKAGGNKRKIYRKADIFKLKETDPVRYEKMQDAILTAYREGRVI